MFLKRLAVPVAQIGNAYERPCAARAGNERGMSQTTVPHDTTRTHQSRRGRGGLVP